MRIADSTVGLKYVTFVKSPSEDGLYEIWARYPDGSEHCIGAADSYAEADKQATIFMINNPQ